MSEQNAVITTIGPSAPVQQPAEPVSGQGLLTSQNFALAQRMAAALCASNLVPENYRGKENLPNAMIALEMAQRIGASPLAVMQNLYIVHGRPAWSSQFLISCVNASGRFSPLRYQMTGTRGTDSWGCIAWAIDKSGERLESPEITIGTAKAEGWFQKNGSKWKTMPDLMLRYRCATLFARLYAPELTMGIQTQDEVIDIAPVVTEPVQVTKAAAILAAKQEPAAMPATATEPTPETAPATEPTETTAAQPDAKESLVKQIRPLMDGPKGAVTRSLERYDLTRENWQDAPAEALQSLLCDLTVK